MHVLVAIPGELVAGWVALERLYAAEREAVAVAVDEDEGRGVGDLVGVAQPCLLPLVAPRQRQPRLHLPHAPAKHHPQPFRAESARKTKIGALLAHLNSSEEWSWLT